MKLPKINATELPYSKEDLRGLLRRHTKKHEDCLCMCPVTGNSIEMLIRFVAVELGEPYISQRKLNTCIKLLTELLSKQCFVKSRLVMASAIVYIAGIKIGERLTQTTIGKMFYVAPVSVRFYKELVRMLPHPMRFMEV